MNQECNSGINLRKF